MASLSATVANGPRLDPEPYIRHEKDGRASIELAVRGAHCANCIARIESGLKQLDGVEDARLNLSTGKLAVRWEQTRTTAPEIIARVEQVGFAAHPYDPRTLLDNEDAQGRFLLRCLAVAGFASANVMLLSISIWSGLGGEMGSATRTMFHWLSGLIAIPAAAYAGRPFFRSALRSLRAGRANMDVPISLAILLALVFSIYSTAMHRDRAYFDAAVMLPFLLLVGRYLDYLLRRKARGAARELVAMQAVTVRRLGADGATSPVPASDLATGDRIFLAVGERVPVDGILEDGPTEVDVSLVTGESTPVLVQHGASLRAGTIIMGNPVVLRATNRVENSFVAELARLVEAGQQSRNRYVRLADRAARLYVPVVHTTAAFVFLTWLLVLHAGVAVSVERAIALLIITCPCALGLAVPAVQIVATGLLFRRGVLVKTGDALERLAEVDVAIFDKTGTLTEGKPALVNVDEIEPAMLQHAARLARASRHPLARAVVEAAAAEGGVAKDAREIPGCGVEVIEAGILARLGRADWVGVPDRRDCTTSQLWFRCGRGAPVCFLFEDRLRSDAPRVMAALAKRGIRTLLLSGDRAGIAESIARQAGLAEWKAEVDPAEKLKVLETIARQHHHVLMAGDGLNDAPALAAAHVSISPGSAVDAAQSQSDMVWTGKELAPIIDAIDVARQARRRVLENFAFAAAYNVVAVPLAALGLVTPLVAAVAMASSSLVVTLNALRLKAQAP